MTEDINEIVLRAARIGNKIAKISPKKLPRNSIVREVMAAHIDNITWAALRLHSIISSQKITKKT